MHNQNCNLKSYKTWIYLPKSTPIIKSHSPLILQTRFPNSLSSKISPFTQLPTAVIVQALNPPMPYSSISQISLSHNSLILKFPFPPSPNQPIPKSANPPLSQSPTPTIPKSPYPQIPLSLIL